MGIIKALEGDVLMSFPFRTITFVLTFPEQLGSFAGHSTLEFLLAADRQDVLHHALLSAVGCRPRLRIEGRKCAVAVEAEGVGVHSVLVDAQVLGHRQDHLLHARVAQG